jgi:hypothetical protein
MTAARSTLDRIRLACLAGRALAPEDGQALAKAIEAAERDEVSIDAALGLAPGWQRAANVRHRDEMLRDLARTLAGGHRAQAREIHARLRRYAASAYAMDLKQEALLDGERARLFEILAANGGDAPGFETIRKIIAAQMR